LKAAAEAWPDFGAGSVATAFEKASGRRENPRAAIWRLMDPINVDFFNRRS